MYIRRKVFSVLEIEGEERLFSTTEVEIQKEFAKADYIGKNIIERGILRRNRSKIADEILKARGESKYTHRVVDGKSIIDVEQPGVRGRSFGYNRASMYGTELSPEELAREMGKRQADSSDRMLRESRDLAEDAVDITKDQYKDIKKKAGLVSLGVAGAAAGGYGIHKVVQKRKKTKEEGELKNNPEVK